MNRKKSSSNILMYTVLIILFVITFYPFVLLLFGSFKDKMQLITNPWVITAPLHFENYKTAFMQIWRPIINSLIIVICGIVLVVTISSLASYAFSRKKFPGSGFLFTMIISLMMIPNFVTLVPQLNLIKDMHLYNTYLGQILPMVANNVALGTMLMTTFFKSVPNSLIEAASIEGCSEMQVFMKIMLPLSKPIISTVTIMCGLRIWNNYIWPLVCTSGESVRPIIVTITRIMTNPAQGDGPLYAAYVIASLPLLILFFFSSKAFISGLVAGAEKG